MDIFLKVFFVIIASSCILSTCSSQQSSEVVAAAAVAYSYAPEVRCWHRHLPVFVFVLAAVDVAAVVDPRV